ncbi:type II toxin-antitoxin system prevent-host-death family antitoxin [Marinitenerispora sediminis]|uniref:Antitoxin n=1 Tax=Marinitenerispora sediminis TaxID=1931232 RepID=A0A368TDY6_9ACTN|nr:type II toxin-antitoxin system prevent-host-death family antitoxin [Marinitenerispora sediminis]RCV60207.1 type II toxin-antitoxin system prevent-host-death family antitoxin [Marinitenerispora sediminis]RCV62130.1 type II toxin-antitoxin system prevent-host-death family antitoxin [Marinitenerispora sediminis]
MTTIPQRELRNNNGAVMDRVRHGETFIVTRHGEPIATISPIPLESKDQKKQLTAAEVQAEFRKLPPIDRAEWEREREEADAFFGPDDPLEDPWERAERRDAR